MRLQRLIGGAFFAAVVVSHAIASQQDSNLRQLQQLGTCTTENFAARVSEVTAPCCAGSDDTTGTGHRRLQDCSLPKKCPSRECRTAFISFYESCQPILLGFLNAPEQANYQALYEDCSGPDSCGCAAGAGWSKSQQGCKPDGTTTPNEAAACEGGKTPPPPPARPPPTSLEACGRATNLGRGTVPPPLRPRWRSDSYRCTNSMRVSHRICVRSSAS
jgi:hypothetical protein